MSKKNIPLPRANHYISSFGTGQDMAPYRVVKSKRHAKFYLIAGRKATKFYSVIICILSFIVVSALIILPPTPLAIQYKILIALLVNIPFISLLGYFMFSYASSLPRLPIGVIDDESGSLTLFRRADFSFLQFQGRRFSIKLSDIESIKIIYTREIEQYNGQKLSFPKTTFKITYLVLKSGEEVLLFIDSINIASMKFIGCLSRIAKVPVKNHSKYFFL